MASMNGQQIYDNFHSRAKGTAGLQDAQDGAQSVAQSFQQRADAVQRLMDSVDQGWQGNAAGQATTAMTPLAVNFNESGDDLAKTQDLVSRQIESFHTTAAKVQPMPPQPQLQDPLTAISTGQGLQPYLNQIAHYSATAQNNVDAMNSYHGASTYNTENLPPVEPALQSSAVPIAVDTSRPSVSGSGGTTGSRPGGSSRSSTPRTRVGTSDTPAATLSPPGTGRPPQTTGPSATAPDQPVTVVSGAGSGGGAGNPPGGGVSAGGISSPGPGAIPGAGVGGNGGGPIGFTEPLPGGPDGAAGSRLGRGVSEPPGGNMPGENPPGEPAPLGSGPRGGSGGAAGEQGPGARSAVGEPGAVAEEENLLARGASSETGVGVPGMLGGRGAGRGEDGEHKRKYKYDEDPEIFGDLPRVARPVIGEP